MERKIGVYICECGPNIAEKIDIDKVIEAVKTDDDVHVVERYKLLCSEDGKKYLVEQIQQQGITHLVVAACSPRDHQQTFMQVCEQAGVNPYLFHLANIREQCAWITQDKEEATNKAIRITKAAIGRVRYHTSLEKKEIDSNPDVLIIGGGIAGIEASLQLATSERHVYLVEKKPELGGMLVHFETLFPTMESTKDFLEENIKKIQENPHITVFTSAQVKECIGFFGNFEISVETNEAPENVNHFDVGAVIVATGASLYDAHDVSQYGYQEFDNVLSALDFGQMNKTGKITLKNGKPPKTVAILHCVGRDTVGYCSEICCMYSLKFIRYLQEKIPGVTITSVYSDLCIPGKSYQHFYQETQGKHVDFIRASGLKIAKKAEQLQLTYTNYQGKQDTKLVDMVILSPALQPPSDISTIADIIGISQGKGGFFTEEHEKLAPVSTATEGVYIAGCIQGPKSVADTIIQAEAVSGNILSSLIPGKKIEPEVKVSQVSEAFCTGCKTCLDVCSYGCITFDEKKHVSVVNEIICRGCGNCVAACPSGAISLKHFTFAQIHEEVKEAIA